MIALDEPTNYLDNETLAALTHGLQNFWGGVILISHNESFVHAVCGEHWELRSGKIVVSTIEKDEVRAGQMMCKALRRSIQCALQRC